MESIFESTRDALARTSNKTSSKRAFVSLSSPRFDIYVFQRAKVYKCHIKSLILRRRAEVQVPISGEFQFVSRVITQVFR